MKFSAQLVECDAPGLAGERHPEQGTIICQEGDPAHGRVKTGEDHRTDYIRSYKKRQMNLRAPRVQMVLRCGASSVIFVPNTLRVGKAIYTR